jgi:NAD(P)-dependent dehydrogenase (short-subunit alcohol dehydrogenase family)
VSDLFDISGKVAVVTGGSRGIGLMIARGFVEGGAKVYISSRKASVCEEVAAELSEIGECIAVPEDLSTEAGCERLATKIAESEDRLDILVNNAGATWGAPIAEHNDDAWDRVLSLNLKGLFHTTRFLLPLLQAAGNEETPARIINIGSIDGIHLSELEVWAYGPSKAAVHHLTRYMANRLAPTITANAIAPGLFESKMTAGVMETKGDEFLKATPLRRMGHPDDIAGTAIYLSSRAGRFVTGSVIAVDGGVAYAADSGMA